MIKMKLKNESDGKTSEILIFFKGKDVIKPWV